MFRVKICGITRVEDALAAAESGADAVGLNFYPKSRRAIDLARAAEIVAALPEGITKVGLFVNAEPKTICGTFDRLGLDLVQLHGDEPPEFIADLGGRPVLRAFRLGPEGLKPVADYLTACRQQGTPLAGVLFDALVEGSYGGTGKVADWSVVATYQRQIGSAPPCVLAGGLTPTNVADAIRTAHPCGVDTSSGVEVSPGLKDPALVAAFVQAARSAFAVPGD